MCRIFIIIQYPYINLVGDHVYLSYSVLPPVRSRVSSVVEHLSVNPKVPGLIPGPSHTGVMDYDEACFMHLTL